MATRTRDGEDAAINLYCQQMGDVQISRPLGSVPPDAIIKHQDGRFEWIEVTSVWLGQTQNKHASFAKAVNNCSSYEGTFDYHFPNGYWKAIHADLIYSIKKKDEKVGYQTLLKEYGKGILILNLEEKRRKEF